LLGGGRTAMSEEIKLPAQDAASPQGEVPPEWQGTAKERESARGSATSRRGFLFKLAVGVNALVGLVFAAPIVGYLIGPALKKEDDYHAWIKLGTVDTFPQGETRLAEFVNPVKGPSDGETAKVACWVRRTDDGKFQVFAINCAHLGCPVRWFEQSKLFLCPCHGGAYYADGSRASGPPERGLFEYQHRIDGEALMIRAGQMPTMTNEACAGRKPLVEIAPANSESRRPS
jgi:menaquinol-cytochrome c reductase iron-sulfur subunit